ncbi:MAG: phosphoribosylamine--glycine ligase [Firmicutes bacterium]|nr:phosphoribosylamine--glycine ligase [Bacillota bacterium]
MRALVIGSGGREHALVKKLAESSLVESIWCYPGNAGIADIAKIPPLSSSSIEELVSFANANGIDLTVVGPENYLADGIVDAFRAEDLTIFGPTQAAAQLESSKIFAKDLMQKHGIPTAHHRVFTDFGEAQAYIERVGAPIVIKADGLAAGKGVTVAHDIATALEAARSTLSGQKVGEAGRRIVVEEFLSGQELSILALCDGKTCLPLTPSQDHKAIGDGDRGPNTGGMGAYSPVPVVDEALREQIFTSILSPTLRALRCEGMEYTGVLYAGLMLTESGPKVIEFNCRFGDPETQAILPRLKTDLAELLLSTCHGSLDALGPIEWDSRACICIVAASKGYPGSYETGFPIRGLEEVEDQRDVLVFHAGTAIHDGQLVTAGGRVLGVSALGSDIRSARDLAYEAIGKIDFSGMYYRKDIGWRALGG